MRTFFSWTLALALLLVVRPSFGFEGIRIAGTAENLQLELSDNTLDDALTALRSAFGLKCSCAVALDRRVTGHYQGSVGRVLSRLLEGNDYVVKTTPSGDVELMVFGVSARTRIAQGATQAVPGAAVPVTPDAAAGVAGALKFQQPVTGASVPVTPDAAAGVTGALQTPQPVPGAPVPVTPGAAPGVAGALQFQRQQ